MIGNKLANSGLPILVSLIGISTISRYIESETGLPVADTTFWWIIQALFLLFFLVANKTNCGGKQAKQMRWILWYVLWNSVSICRGLFIAETYWDWKGLTGNAMALLIPVCAYTATNSIIMSQIFRWYFRYALPLFLVFAFLIAKDAYGFYLVPASLFLLFLPVLTWRGVIICLICAVVVFTADLGARSNIIKFGTPIVFSMVYYFVKFIPKRVLEYSRKLLFLLPIVFFLFGVSGFFNIFKMDDYISASPVIEKRDSSGAVISDNLKDDTRTFLYEEVLYTAYEFDSWWIGRSPARGTISAHFGGEDLNGRGERLGNEVAILNVFTWTGIVGVLLYCFIFYKASFLAVNYSNNDFSKIMGLFLGFRWIFSWVEDINYFTFTTVYLWLLIGMCFSSNFRSMTNIEFKLWVRDVFKWSILPKIRYIS